MTNPKKSVILPRMKTNAFTIFLLIVLMISVYIFTFPASFNRGVDFVNEKTVLTLEKVPERDFAQGLDLQGGAYLLYEADLSEVPPAERSRRMEGLRDLMERRIDLYGLAESSVQVSGERIAIEIPGAHDLEEAMNIIGETPFLDFREISPEKEEKQNEKWEEIEKHLGKERGEIEIEDLLMLGEEVEDWGIVLEESFEKTDLTGEHLESAGVSLHPVSREPVITLEFTSEGAELFAEITERNVGKNLATFLDDEILQVAVVQEEITGGQAQITGGFSTEEAYEIARDLQIGALPVPISPVAQQSIGPELGEDALESVITAGLYGFALVAIFMIAVYRLQGLIAVLSLAVYVLLVSFLFKNIPVTLTLSGIAGFLLSVGMAIDANILIISRTKEEMQKGKSIPESVEEGYQKAWSSIRDGNFTTLMVAVILFFITTSFVRGFAITLMLGIIVSLFSAMVISKAVVSFLAEKLPAKKEIWN